MSKPLPDYIERRIEEDAETELQHIKNNPSELYDFYQRNLAHLEQLFDLIYTHRRDPRGLGTVLWHQIENDLWTECKSNVRSRYYD